MENSKVPPSKAEPKWPSPMMETESPISLRRSIELMTPRWLKRVSRRGRSAR